MRRKAVSREKKVTQDVQLHTIAQTRKPEEIRVFFKGKAMDQTFLADLRCKGVEVFDSPGVHIEAYRLKDENEGYEKNDDVCILKGDEVVVVLGVRVAWSEG